VFNIPKSLMSGSFPSVGGTWALLSLAVPCHTCLMRTMVSARLPNDLVSRMDALGPRGRL
jgi:hypothetical protein